MSMTINLVEDHNIYLCEGGPVYKGGVQPTPITYLTQWKIVGNSEVHTLPYPDGVVLPNGYKRCKYLEFHGNEYINSKVYTKEGIGMAVTFQTEASNAGKVFGARKDYSNSSFIIGFNSSYPKVIQAGYGGYTKDIVMASSYRDGNVHTVYLDSEQAQVDGVPINFDRGTFAMSYMITIGALNNSGGIAEKYIGKIYSAIIYDTQQVLFNGIPCLDANDVPCFYDIVSQTAFYNQDSGSFTYELYPQPTEIWFCGEYSSTDGKYHVVVLPTGKQAVDIVLDEPLRKVNDIADTLEYPLGISGKALLTTRVAEIDGELTPLVTPTIALVDVPQIEESTEYSNVIAPGSKAVEWSSFETNSE